MEPETPIRQTDNLPTGSPCTAPAAVPETSSPGAAAPTREQLEEMLKWSEEMVIRLRDHGNPFAGPHALARALVKDFAKLLR